MADVVERRLAAIYGTAGVGLPGDSTIATPVVAEKDASWVGSMLPAPGVAAFVPLGSEPVAAGDPVDLAKHPALFGGEAIASSATGSDQTGRPTIELTLTDPAATTFATWTSAHIGEYLAIVVDGKALAAPVIKSAIADGKVSIGLSGQPDDAVRQTSATAALLAGPLPHPLTVVGTSPAEVPASSPTPPAIPAESATPVPTPAPSDIATPVPTATPGASAAVLALTKVSGLPGTVQQVVRWTGGYLAVVLDADLNTSLWSSTDARAWQRSTSAESLLGGLGGAPAVQAATCGQGVLVMATRADGTTRIAWTTDLTTGSTSDFTGQAASSVVGLSGSAEGAIASTEGGKTVVTRDCASWESPVIVSQQIHLTGVGMLGSRFIAVGWTGTEGHETAAAWWSDDGASWSSAKVTAPNGMGFISAPVVGRGGAMAVLASPGGTGGISLFFGTTDGAAWAAAPSPLGKLQGEAGSGSDAGLLAGSGSRILVAGSPGTNQSAPTQYWLGDGGSAWHQLTLSGSKADLASVNAGGLAFILPDGLLLSGDGGTFVATGTMP